jgi:Sulfate permease family
LVEVESGDEGCLVDGRSLGPPRLPVRPRSWPGVCAVVGIGARTGVTIAETGARASSFSSGAGILAAAALRDPPLDFRARMAEVPRPDAGTLRHDAVAGVPGAIASVPDGMASAALVGLNPVYGLYASLAGPIGGGRRLARG